MTSTPAPPAGLTVFLVDDHAIVRSGVSAYLDMIDDITVAGEAGTGQQALDRIAALEPADGLPDVVLMDLLMPGMDGIEATRQLKARWPVIEVVAVTSFLEEAKVRAALQAGGVVSRARRRAAGERPHAADPRHGRPQRLPDPVGRVARRRAPERLARRG